MPTKLQFNREEKIDFMVELRKKVDEYFQQNNLSKHADADMVAKSIFMMALYLGPYLLMVTGVVSSTLLILLCWVVMGIGMAGVGVDIMHDANHGSYSKSKPINQWLSKSLYILGGLPETWQIQHNTIHHAYTNIDGYDADIDPAPMLRFSPHKPVRKIHKYQHLYAWFLYGLMTILWFTTKDFQQLFHYSKEGYLAQEGKSFNALMTKLVITKIMYYVVFIVIPLIVLPIPWWMTLLFFFIMHFIAGVLLSVIFQTGHILPDSAYPLPDENGNLENNWLVHQLTATSDYAPNSRVFTWLLGGLNYHAVHHLFPNICHVHYKKISPIVKEITAKYGVTYRAQPTFFKAIGNHAKMLKLLGQGQYASH
ncbi:MAG: acyl-CoA desaturase [Bacteroidales bacterium]|nr:acyl-CoA desaturase [Bacteroidales bacterium]